MLARTKTSLPSSSNGALSDSRIPLGDLGRLHADADVLEQDGELVAAEARCGVDGAQGVLQAASDVAQHLVSRGVAERVVDRLEVVQVHEQHRGVLVLARLPVQCVLDTVAEQSAVGESGHGVVEGLVGELLLELLALADVAHVDHDAGHVRVVHQVRAQRLDGDGRAVAVAQAELHQARVADRAASAVREEPEHPRVCRRGG